MIILAWVQQVNCLLGALSYSITATYALTNLSTSICIGQGIDTEAPDSTCFNSYWQWALIHGGMQIVFSYIPGARTSEQRSVWGGRVVGAAGAAAAAAAGAALALALASRQRRACSCHGRRRRRHLFASRADMDSSMWPCVVGALMSVGYSCISIGRAAAEGNAHGTIAGITGISTSDKVFGIFNAFGASMFAYNFSMILPEIQARARRQGQSSVLS